MTTPPSLLRPRRAGEKVPQADEGGALSHRARAPHPAFGHPLPAKRGEGTDLLERR